MLFVVAYENGRESRRSAFWKLAPDIHLRHGAPVRSGRLLNDTDACLALVTVRAADGEAAEDGGTSCRSSAPGRSLRSLRRGPSTDDRLGATGVHCSAAAGLQMRMDLKKSCVM
jgi:hypothetical protein